MGTSKRKISKDIKKLLNTEITNINETAPEISKKILGKKTLNENFHEETINASIKIITSQFLSLGVGGYSGKKQQELANDPVTKEEFIEMILNEIENSSEIKSKILEKSLKIVMSEYLKFDEFDTYSFTHSLFSEIIYQILLGDLNDTIKEVYEEVEYSVIKIMVKNLTNQIMNDSVFNKVNLFIDRKITLFEVLNEISNQTDRASFGEF